MVGRPVLKEQSIRPSPEAPFLATRPTARLILASAAVVAAYFAGGKAGLLLAGSNPSVTAVWPPTGIALAALILGGAELWPAVFAGAFLVNITTTWDLGSTLGLASGNTLEAIVGAFLATRFASGKHLLDAPTTVLKFVGLSGLLACTIAATVGSLTLIAARLAPPSGFLTLWVPYWLGDTIGAIELTPLILVGWQRGSGAKSVLPSPGWAEATTLSAVVVLVALVVFARNPIAVLGGSPLVFLVVPPTVWAAFRFGARGAVTSVSIVSVVAIVATVTGNGPFALLPSGVSLLALRIFIGSLAVTALLVAAETVRHEQLAAELNRARKELQRMLSARTAELDAARSLARVGTWSYAVRSRKLIWSEEMYQIFGYGPERFPLSLDRALERVAPGDRDVARGQLERAILSGAAPVGAVPEAKLRLLLPGGEERTVVSKVQVAETENDSTARVSGTVLDITEFERMEEELERLTGLGEEGRAPPGDFSLWMIPWGSRRRP